LEPLDEHVIDGQNIDDFVYRNVTDILKIAISKLQNKSSIAVNDTVFLKLGGDGRQVGRQVKHTMLTICILNEHENVLKPDHQYTLSLQVGPEKYELLAATLHGLNLELAELKENGFTDDSANHWPIELFASADWKFLALVLGLNGPTSSYFCFYDNCHKDDIHNMSRKWVVEKEMASIINNFTNVLGQKNPCILTSIELKNWILDELHLMLRITDILFETLWEKLTVVELFEKNILPKLNSEFERLSVSFHFYQNEKSGKKWQWSSLMGPAKLKILQKFNLR